MPSYPANKIVEVPLTPAVLEDIGVVEGFPSSPAGYDPSGSWSHLYRIWLCHGFYGQLNLDAGYLCIERITAAESGRFTLSIEQQAVNWEGILNTIQAEIVCGDDDLSTPRSWKYSSRFTDVHGIDVPALAVEQEAVLEGETIRIVINGVDAGGDVTGAVTADWCLFDAVQRLQLNGRREQRFDFLEGLTLLKKNHRLSPRTVGTDAFRHLHIPLKCYVQTGDGVLPYEYWIDTAGRLLLATSGNRAYILDDRAGEVFTEELQKHRGGEYSWQNKL